MDVTVGQLATTAQIRDAGLIKRVRVFKTRSAAKKGLSITPKQLEMLRDHDGERDRKPVRP